MSRTLDIASGLTSIHLYYYATPDFLPSYSPELQPAERLWSILDEPIANRTFEEIEDLEQTVRERCCVLLKRRDFIRGLANFHWWQEVNA